MLQYLKKNHVCNLKKERPETLNLALWIGVLVVYLPLLKEVLTGN